MSLKNDSMISQIALLKKANVASSKGLKDSAHVIENFLKMNEEQTKAIKSKLISSDSRLKNAQKEVSKLCKSYHRATQVKNHAVETAKAKVIQQKSVHHLANKAVFIEDTHNLVCLIFQAVQQITSVKLLLLYSNLQALR